MNQSRCCAKESGWPISFLDTGWMGGMCNEPMRPESIRSASAAMVGASNMRCSGKSKENAARAREMTWVANRELPPRSKKRSRTPAFSTPSTWVQMETSISSVGLRGAMYSPRLTRVRRERA